MNWALVVSISVAISGTGCSWTPSQPQGVPGDAVWAGAGPGHAWIQCRFVTKEPWNAYDCQVFRADGRVWATGVYVLGSESQGEFRPFGGPFAPSPLDRARSFDGVKIQRTEQTVLVPDGWIEYAGSTGNTRAFFQLGRRVEPKDPRRAG